MLELETDVKLPKKTRVLLPMVQRERVLGQSNSDSLTTTVHAMKLFDNHFKQGIKREHKYKHTHVNAGS